MFNIVCGPPGSGKSTFVERNRKSGDVIVDVDALYHAITGLPYYDKPNALLDLVLTMRDVLLANLPRYKDRFHNAWIITGGASLESRTRLAMRYNARVFIIETSPSECLRRIANDPRRSDKVALWQEPVYKWWREYERCSADTVVKPDWAR